MPQIAAVVTEMQGREALAQGRIQLLELQCTGGQLLERLQAALLFDGKSLGLDGLTGAQQLLPLLFTLLGQLLEAPLAPERLQLGGAAGLNLPLLEAEPLLRSHQLKPAHHQLSRSGATADEISEISERNRLT